MRSIEVDDFAIACKSECAIKVIHKRFKNILYQNFVRFLVERGLD